jgi:hypothetical protein
MSLWIELIANSWIIEEDLASLAGLRVRWAARWDKQS